MSWWLALVVARAAGDSWHVYPVGLAVFATDLASANTPVFHGISRHPCL